MLRWLVVLLLAAAWSGSAAASSHAGAAGDAPGWCGGAAATADLPDAIAGAQWHVVYALPVGAGERLGELAGGIVADLEAIGSWWRLQDPTRTPTFDLASFPGCETPLGGLDITALPLPRSPAEYESANALGLLAADLAAVGLDAPSKKYLVYVEAGSGNPSRCGEANAGLAGGGSRSLAVVFLGACNASVGTGSTSAAITAAHELVHGLDALVQSGPPHACPAPDTVHVCDAANDILYPHHGGGTTLDQLFLDLGRDDYYGHGGGWWDIRSSPFLTVIATGDVTPPGTPDALTATSRDRSLTVTWVGPADETELVYRISVDGVLTRITSAPTLRLDAPPGRIVVIAVQAVDQAGLAGPAAIVRFRVGFGVVDETGALVADTVPPPPVGDLRVGQVAGKRVLRWRQVADRAGPLRGYEVIQNGRRRAIVRSTSFTLPRSGWPGAWWVRAIDGAGNVGRRADVLYLRLRD